MMPSQEFKEDLPFTREQMQAAYALNLCTVSVSQIIDYNDMTVLDQEYETILNNLNLEYMPKDNALLEILKRLLETITFFRIQESEKEFIEKEYQQKMKNAIWTAVPNLALLVAGANPVSLGVSLAAQIGIGYMNYRKNRSQYHLDRDQQLWKLQRSAMEQFEGLKQQLFETAWRLADKYGFPDAFRLTERQIRQYNDILMDTDELRKYERLDSVKTQFAAYPPFWYYFGSTANAIADRTDLGLDGASRLEFKDRARKYFEYFQQSSGFHLLREDAITASCCLEYADLLDPAEDKEKILKLIDDAARFGGSSWDVHQLCAISYMKAGENKKAAEELRLLVNENYNAVVNAQLLSSIYVQEAMLDDTRRTELPYRMLATRVNSEYLFPMPGSLEVRPEELQNSFVENQKKILGEMNRLVLSRFMEKYEIQINKIIPLPEEETSAPAPSGGSDFLYRDAAREERKSRVRAGLANKNLEVLYRQEAAAVPYSYEILRILNRMFASVSSLEGVQEEQNRLVLQKAVEDAIHDCRGRIEAVEAGLQDFSEEVYASSQELTVYTLTGEFYNSLLRIVQESVSRKSELQDFALAQTGLVHFCSREGLELPEDLFRHRDDAEEEPEEEAFFTMDLLSEHAVAQNERVKKNTEMLRLIRESMDRVVVEKDDVEFFTQEDARMNRYFYNKALQKFTGMRSRTLAVLDDRSKADCDLLFTTRGVMAVIRGHAKAPVAYEEIVWTGNTKKKELRIGVKYESANLDMDALYELFQSLAAHAERIH